MDEEQKKISLPEEILIYLILVFAWVIDIFVTLTGVGIIVAEAINWALGGGLTLYFTFKGSIGVQKLAQKLVLSVIGTIIETSVFIPGKIITTAICFYLINHPKLTKVAEVATGKISSLAKPEAAGGEK